MPHRKWTVSTLIRARALSISENFETETNSRKKSQKMRKLSSNFGKANHSTETSGSFEVSKLKTKGAFDPGFNYNENERVIKTGHQKCFNCLH